MPSQAAVCTLFEGHYHYGVAALVNSLYQQGFKGDIYAGYRGQLPAWVKHLPTMQPTDWAGAKSFQLIEELRLHFLPLDTDYHLTNFKPDFMLLLWEKVVKHAGQLFYFDPDIVIQAPWDFYQYWATCGVALCEDVNSPLAEFHPRRVAWRQYFSSKGIELHFRDAIYVNGGFVGVETKEFLSIWREIQLAMAQKIGGLNRSSLTGTPLMNTDQGSLAPFDKTDQDALNAAVEAWKGDVSFIGKEAMAFKAGTILMPHALGQPKPWQWPYLTKAVQGISPRLVDRAYWHSANDIIRSQPNFKVLMKKTALNVATFIGRFYKRGPF